MISSADWEKYMLDYVETVAMTAPHREMRRLIAARVARHAGGRDVKVFDAGCAAGALYDDIIKVHQGGLHYTGFDRHPELFRLGEKQFSPEPGTKVVFVLNDMNNGFGDNKDADIVVWSLSAYCMNSFHKAVEDSRKALKPNGVLIMVNPFEPNASQIAKAHQEWLESDAGENERGYFASRVEGVKRVMAFNKRIADEAIATRYHFLQESDQRELVESQGFRVIHASPDALENTSVFLVARNGGKVNKGVDDG